MWVLPCIRREFTFAFLFFALHALLHVWAHTRPANSVARLFLSSLREELRAFSNSTFLAGQHILAVCADASAAAVSGIFGVAGKTCLGLPEVTAQAFIRSACILLLLQALLTTAECIFARPLRCEEAIFEYHELTLNASFRRRVLFFDGLPIDALPSQSFQQ